MKVYLEERENESRVCIKGNLGVNESKELREVFEKLIENGKPNIIIDFSDVKSVNSVSIGHLIYLRRNLDNDETRFTISNIDNRVYKILIGLKMDLFYELLEK